MKKITFYLMMLLSASVFAQIEINENFDATANNQVPAGWTETNFGAASNFTCDASAKAITTAFTGPGQETLTTPNYTAISNGTDLTVSFSYNILEQVSQFPPPSYVGPATAWGSIALEYTTDGVNWTNITTIDDSNFTYVSTSDCSATADINVGTIANGSDFQARFVVTVANISNFALWVSIDNVSFNQVATAIPNCDVTLLSPVNGSDTADADVALTWQAATGLPTGYTVSVGTTSGGTDIVNAVTTTETNYPLTGLAYETEYFVNIVPYNSIGDAVGCTEESFTTRIAPIPGATCSSPIVISSFPFIEGASNTDDYEDNIDVSPCSNTYMNGKDVFYEITPATDISINIELANISNNGAGVHVINGCPDVATECIAYVGTFSGDTRSLTEVVLLAGNTYFVVLSNSGSTRTYTYDLIITENSCIDPTIGAMTSVADCGNGQFSVDVDVTYLGSATSLTLSDDDATTADITNITSTGVVTVGPYPSGTLVNFTLTNDQDGTCSYTDSTFFYCPPVNDECGASTSLTVNTDETCTIFTSATNAGATESVADPSPSCSSTNTNDVWFDFTATSESMILEYLNLESAPGFPAGGIFQSTELLSGTCGSLTSIACYTSSYVTFTGLTVGNTYYIRSKTNLGTSQQNYDICLKEAPSAPVNDDCANADTLAVPTVEAATEMVLGTTVGATLSTDNSCETSDFGDVWYVLNPTVTGVYEFSIEENPTGQEGSVSYSIYEGSCGALTAKIPSCTSSNSILTLNAGTTYYAMVQSSLTNPGVTFDFDVTKLPDAAVNSDCSGAIAFNESPDAAGVNRVTGDLENSYYSPEGACSSTYESVWYKFTPTYTGTYHFELIRTSGTAYYTVYDSDVCSTDLDYLGGDINSCFESGTDSGPVVAGNTYLVSIQASSAAEFEFFAYPDATLSVDSNNFEAFKYFPNPVVNTLTVEAQNSISKISIFNIVGQKVQQVAPNNLRTVVDMNELNKGVYFVTVTINESQQTFKVIKK